MSQIGVRSPLLREEDWWAVWFGFIIIIAALTGLVDKVPKIGKWTSNPLDVFFLTKDGQITGCLFLPLLKLWLALGVLTSIGVAVMSKPGGILQAIRRFMSLR